MHSIENVRTLDMDVELLCLPLLDQGAPDLLETVVGRRCVHQQRHREDAVHDRLVEVQDIDRHGREQGAHVCYDPHPVFGQYRHDGFHKSGQINIININLPGHLQNIYQNKYIYTILYYYTILY